MTKFGSFTSKYMAANAHSFYEANHTVSDEPKPVERRRVDEMLRSLPLVSLSGSGRTFLA